MALNPWRLRLLVQLEALGTVRAVAAAAHQSASSVSQQLTVLETEAGAQLFERTGRRLRLTTAGTVLAARAREILDLMAAAEAELRAMTDEPSGVVRVAAFQSAVHALVVPAARDVRERHRLVEVHVEEREPHESTAALLRGDVDLAVTTTDFLDQPRHRDVHSVPLSTDAIVVVAPRGHAVETMDTVDLSRLADDDWAFDIAGAYMSDLATRRCREAGFEPRVVCRFNNYLLTLQHVESAGTVALLPALAVDPRHDVVTRPLSPPAERRITAAVRTSSVARPAVSAVLDALRSAVSQ